MKQRRSRKTRCSRQKSLSGATKELSVEYQNVKKELVSPFTVSGVLDRVRNANMSADTGCNLMGAINSEYSQLKKLQRVHISPRMINAYDDKPGERVSTIVKTEVMTSLGGSIQMCGCISW